MAMVGDGPVTWTTERLRLEPISIGHAEDYLQVFSDDAIAEWYAGKPSRAEVKSNVEQAGRMWAEVGFHKWLAYECDSGVVVGRGGVSAMRLAGSEAIRTFLPTEPWVEERMDGGAGGAFVRRWVEVGWAVRGEFWGKGYASEIGRASLAFAFEIIGMRAVVSFTERHNVRSRAVMERIGMRYMGEILREGLIEGRDGVHPAAPFALYVLLQS